QQIEFLQVVNDADADVLITTTLEELKNLSATTQQATQSWRKGDMDKLDEVKGKKLRTQAPALYSELVVKRNKSWLPAFAGMLKSDAVEMVLWWTRCISPDRVICWSYSLRKATPSNLTSSRRRTRFSPN